MADQPVEYVKVEVTFRYPSLRTDRTKRFTLEQYASPPINRVQAVRRALELLVQLSLQLKRWAKAEVKNAV